MNSYGDLLNAIGTHSVLFTIAAAVLVSLTSMIAAFVLRKQPALRHTVLLWALLSCLFAAVAGFVTAASRQAIVSIPVLVGKSDVVATISVEEISPMKPIEGKRSLPAKVDSNATSMAIPAVSGSSKSQSPQPAVRFTAPTLPVIVATIWGLGTMQLLAFAYRSYRRGLRIRKTATSMSSPRLVECASTARLRAGLPTMPPILRSERVSAPVVHGCRKPAVMPPPQILESISDDELTDILVHEFAHIRRRDTWVVAVEAFVRAMFWPVITVHQMIRALGRAREEVCDNYVITQRDPLLYAETLLRIAQLRLEKRVSIPSVGILHWKGELERRVLSLIDPDRSRSRKSSKPIVVLIALLFVSVGVAISGSRLVAIQPQADQAVVDKNKGSSKPSVPMLSHTFRVVDWRGNPISGADVELWQLAYSAAKGLGGGSQAPREFAFEGKTDAQGQCSIPYPIEIGPSKMPVTGLAVRVTHPEHPGWSEYREVSETNDIQLFKPIVLKITARKEGEDVAVKSNLYGLAGDRKLKWEIEQGRLVSGPMSTDNMLCRVVHSDESGAIWFSDLVDPSNSKMVDGHASINIVLHPSVELRGRLDYRVKRPVLDGRVICRTTPKLEPKQLRTAAAWWETSTSIDEDGKFVLRGLPAGTHVQLIAFCEGGVSRSPTEAEVQDYCRDNDYDVQRYFDRSPGRTSPQLFYADKDREDLTVRTIATGDVEVTVQDWESKPIKNARVHFAPNQQWHNGGSQVLGQSRETLDYLKQIAAGEDPVSSTEESKLLIKSYTATTDDSGKVVIRNLPAGRVFRDKDDPELNPVAYHGFTVNADGYELVRMEPVRIFGAGLPQETVDMVPSGLAKIQVRMERTDRRLSVVQVKELMTNPPAKLATNSSLEKPKKKGQSKPTQREITVRGVATSFNNTPVAGASIHLVSVNGLRKRIAATTSDADGNYVFDNVSLPIRKTGDSGTIDIFGVAKGFGLIWHGQRFVTDSDRPESSVKSPHDHSFYRDEPIEMNLSFPGAATMSGRVLDNQSRPVAGAKITINNLDFLDTEGRTMHPNFREFGGLQFLPSELRSCRTDAEGDFKIDGLPQDTVAWVNLSHKEFANQSHYVAITDRQINEYTYIANSSISIHNGKAVYEPIIKTRAVVVSPLAFGVQSNQSLLVHVVDEKKAPISNARVSATSGGMATGTSAFGKSDDSGTVQLDLPPGEYRLSITPDRKTERVPMKETLTITPSEDQQHRTFTPPLGCVLLFKAIDSKSGEPIAGVKFWAEMDSGRGRSGVQSAPSYVDHPVTGEDGELRAVVMPGSRKYGVGFSVSPDGYRGGMFGREINCESGSTLRVTFELRKQN